MITSNGIIAPEPEPDVSISPKGCIEISHENVASLIPEMPPLLAAMKELFQILRRISIPTAWAQVDLVAGTDLHSYQAAIHTLCQTVVSTQD